MNHATARRLLAIAIAGTALSPAYAATFDWNNPDGGAMNVSTNWSPAGVPGPSDVAVIRSTSTLTGFMTLTLPANQAIGTLQHNHFAQNTISGPGVLTIGSGTLSLTDGITASPDEALNALFINTQIHGAAGLNVGGGHFVRLNAANLYGGGTTILGGGVTVTADNNLGSAGTGITLNGGTLRAGSSFATPRPITLGVNGGRLESFGNLTLTGVISGSGSLFVERFAGGSVTLAAVNNYAGSTNITNGNTVNLTGRLTSTSAIVLGGTLNLGTTTVGLASDAVNDLASINSLGGRLNLYAPSTNATETLGSLNLANGTTTINLEANANAGIALNLAAINRSNRSTAFIRGRDLGNGTLAANRAILNVTNSLPLVGGGGTAATNDSIVPFLFGNANTTGGVSQASVVEAGFVTRTTNGLRVLDASDYATSLASGATNNVRLTNAAITSNTSAVTVNSLLLRDTLASSGPTGISGTAPITVTSGAIGAVSDLAGEELYIDNPINFGTAEGIIHTAPTSDGHSNLTLRGAISGSGGLTKSGSGELTLTGSSTFTGGLTVNGGLVNFDVSAGAGGSSLGNGNTITINAGVSDNQYVGLRSMTPGINISRPITVQQSSQANSLALLGTLGGYGTNYSGSIFIEGGFLNLLGDTEPQVMTLSGGISGAGGLREPNTHQPIAQYLRVTGNNTYSGDTLIRIGRWEVGSNSALGFGRVFFTEEGGSLQAFGGARSLNNNFVFRATPTFGGSDALTLTGQVDLGSINRDIIVNNTADTTFAGTVSRGGIVKLGDGRLILSGVNGYNGQTLIAAGALRAANSLALGASTGDDRQATYILGTGALELANSVSINESIYFGAATPITLARPDGNLRSVSGLNSIAQAIAFDAVGTVGVDAGSELTLTGDTLDNTTTGTARLRKVGAGRLTVKNVRLSGLQIDAGQVRVTSSGAPNGTSRVSALDIAPGASLDLTNNALVYDYTTTSPLAAVQALLLSDRILTSVATPGAAIGIAEASRLFTTFPQNFASQPIDSTTVVLLQTLAGDTNLDRNVNFDDLLRLAQNYGSSGRTWVDGDFDYNGLVDFDDLLALAQTYGGSVTLQETQVLASVNGEFASDFARAMSLVPEPALIGVGALLLPVARRRRFMR